ncbi:hypothetical protein N8T08_009219 [Aspergillus melleus]|uniref:Uncharacterized protein n=1 Tax=Aspergillus melleus TaxID=138277 RepID=A0ACC3AU93_9EURO|nr:hypothetical protein N8T08_009219 [Aspergillus melleus]
MSEVRNCIRILIHGIPNDPAARLPAMPVDHARRGATTPGQSVGSVSSARSTVYILTRFQQSLMPDYSQLFSCAPESTLKWPVFKDIVTDSDSSLYSFLLESQKEDNKSVYVEKVPDRVKDDSVEPCIRFLSSANRRNPIVDAEQLKRSARKVTEEGPGWDASSCLVLLACTLSHLSDPFQNRVISDGPDACPPSDKHVGEAYLNEAKKRFGNAAYLADRHSMFLLASLYEKYAIRPLEAWICIQQASSRLKLRLASRQAPLDSHDRHLEQRLELQLEVPLEASGFENCRYPDPFPEPLFNETTSLYSPSSIGDVEQEVLSDASARIEERGWFFYLAEISFRRIFDSIVLLLYQDSPRRWTTNITRLIRQCKESDEQMSLWFAHLPPPIRPTTPPTNDLSFFLRGRYLSSREKIHRPLIYVALHHPGLLDPETSQEAEELLSLAQQSIDFCAALIPHYSVHFRQGGTWFVLCGSFEAALLILGVIVGSHRSRAAQTPCLQPPDDWVCLVKLSLKTLRKWEDESKDVEMMRIMLEGILGRVCRKTTQCPNTTLY